jgi:hypothetical protein
MLIVNEFHPLKMKNECLWMKIIYDDVDKDFIDGDAN